MRGVDYVMGVDWPSGLGNGGDLLVNDSDDRASLDFSSLGC